MRVSKQTVLLRCLLSVGILSSALCQATLTVGIDPQSKLVLQGIDQVLNCSYSGSGIVTDSVSFYKDSALIDVASNSGKYEYTSFLNSYALLTIKDFQSSNAGTYFCRVSNVAGSVKSPDSILTYRDLPIVNIPKPMYTVRTGQNVTLVCHVTFNEIARIVVYWKKNVVSGTIFLFSVSSNKYSGGSANSPSLTIFNASQSDAGIYTCVATYSPGTGTSTTTLFVLGEFNITRLTIDGNLHEDSGATFVCSANVSGNVRNITTVWKLNDAVITPTSTSRWQAGTIPVNPEDQAKRQYYLQVTSLQTADTGTITCQLSHGTVQTEMKINVSVMGKPVVSLSSTTLTVYKGETIYINCIVSEWFATNTSIVWYQDGVMVQSKKGQMTDVLYISEIQGTSTFECSAINLAGEGKRRRSIINVIEPGVCYKFCPTDVDAFNTTWKSTFGATKVEISCKRNYTGIVTRFCNVDGFWEEPNYSVCVREDLQELHKQSEYLKNGVQVGDVDTMLLELTQVTSEDNVDLTSGDLDVTSSILLNVADIAPRSTHSGDNDQLETFISSCNNVLQSKNKPSWKQLSSLNFGGITKIAEAVTTYTKAYISVNNTEFQRVVEKDNIVVEVGKTLSQDITLPNKSLTLSSWLSGSESRITLQKVNINETFRYSSAFYRNISELFHHYILPVGSAEPVNSSYDVNSMIVDFSIEPTTDKLVKPVVVEFDHISAGLSDPLCAFWNFSVPNTPNGAWSMVGSRLVNSDAVSTVCEFDHTTNFAILMSPARTPASHVVALDLISAVGCGVSLLFLVVTLVVYGVLWRYINSDRGKSGKVRERAIMLVNLCTALIISYALFMAGIKQTRNKTFCTAIAVTLHYIFLVDFSLMLAAGVEIAFSLMQVLSQKSRIRWLLPSCWFVPAIVVVISASVTKLEGYGTSAFCWLSLDSGLLWAFAGPALLIIMINFVILVLVIRISLRTHLMKAKNIKEKAKFEIRNICVLLPLFGLTWGFGLLSVNDESVVFQYIFAILNSLQGFFIFVFHCFLDKTVRKGLQHILRKVRNSQLDSTTNSHRNKKSSSQNETSTSHLESAQSTGLHHHESTKETNNEHAATTTEGNDKNKKDRKTLQEDSKLITNTRNNYASSDKPYDVHEENEDSKQHHNNRIRRRSSFTDSKRTAVPQMKGRHTHSKSQRFHAEIPVDRKIRSTSTRHLDTSPAIDDYQFYRDYYGDFRDAYQEGYYGYQQFGQNTGRFYPPFIPDYYGRHIHQYGYNEPDFE